MMNKLEDWLFNKFLGKVLARLAVTICGYLASGILGKSLHVDQAELTALLIALAHGAYEAFKGWRTKPVPQPTNQSNTMPK